MAILNYHSVYSGDLIEDEWSIPASLFALHMRYLAENDYNVISVDKAVGCLKEGIALPEKTICLTFDDGFRNNYTQAFPELLKNGFTATIYVVTSFIDQTIPFPWLMQIDHNLPLKWEYIFDMAAAGITFGPHTHTHADLSCASEASIQNEIDKSIHILKDRLPFVSNTFVCPYGIIGKEREILKAHLKLRKHEAAFLGRFGTAQSGSDFFDLPRITIYGDDSLFVFRQKLKGAYDWIAPIHIFWRYIRNII